MMPGRRWAIAYVLTPLAAAVLIVPARPSPPPCYDHHRHPTTHEASTAARSTRCGWQIAARFPPASSPRTLHDTAQLVVGPASDVPAAFSNEFRESVERSFAAFPRHEPTSRLLVSVVVDTGETIAGIELDRVAKSPGWYTSDAFLPGSIAESTCSVVLRIHSDEFAYLKTRGWDMRTAPPGFGLGPCPWYSAYGNPGRGVSAWLDSTGNLAVRAKWPYGDFNGGLSFIDTRFWKREERGVWLDRRPGSACSSPHAPQAAPEHAPLIFCRDARRPDQCRRLQDAFRLAGSRRSLAQTVRLSC